MSEPIIEIKNVGKKYNITHQRGGYVALRDVLANVFKNPFQFAKHKAKQVVGLETKEEFWALRNINFTVNRGEVIGIIGHNGAGKSTLLKILTGITPPTEGEIVMHGRVASLLEVGTGFHPELTGRENVFLNGAILGMTKKEIARKFDEIVAFAGVEKFLDTPVKYYSSGMYVRLAFSVAAHMEPDILLLDEVLAVGDAEFQKKCLGKMEEVTQKNGRTILFVSHNLIAIEKLCNKTILLEQGKIREVGETEVVIKKYLSGMSDRVSAENHTPTLEQRNNSDHLGFTDVRITDRENSPLIHSHSKLAIEIGYTSDRADNLFDIRVLISIFSQRSGQMVFRLDSHVSSETLEDSIKPRGTLLCKTGTINLVEGEYRAEIALYPQKTRGYVKTESYFTVTTDNEIYNYRQDPDRNVTDHLIAATFSQK
ncbi:MAG: ABC transporter ATP-binding protein [Minisyncoccota bacterium]